MNTLTPQVQAAQTAMDKAQAAYQCEVDGSGPGCEGASDKAGQRADRPAQAHGADSGAAEVPRPEQSAAVRAADLQTAQSAAEKASGQTLKQQQTAAKAELPGLQKQYSQLEAQLKKNEAQAQGAVEHNTGILAQLHDLSAAGAKNPMLSVAQWVVTLLFFCIEILPVMIKVLLNIGPLSNYEELLKNEEDIIADNAKIKRVTRRRAAEREARRAEREAVKQEVIDKHMVQLEEDLGKKANKHVAQHMEAILDVALADWSRQVQAKLSGQLPPGSPPGPRVRSAVRAGTGPAGRYGRSRRSARHAPTRSRG